MLEQKILVRECLVPGDVVVSIYDIKQVKVKINILKNIVII